MAANEANNKALGAKGGVLTAGKPHHVYIAGDRAYVTLPGRFADTEKGKAVTQTATWTLTLQKVASGWVFTGSSWGQR